jgi:hypothetical protein
MTDRWDSIFRDDGMLHAYLRTKYRGLQRTWKEARQIQWNDLVTFIGESEISQLPAFRQALMKDAWIRMSTRGGPT